MNCLIAKAAKSRGNYIEEKYYLGLECTNCKNYLNLLNCYFQKQCINSNCNCACCAESTSTFTISSDCPPIIASEINVPCSDISITASGTYSTCTMTNIEITSYVLNAINTLGKKAKFIVSSFIVNSVEMIPTHTSFILDEDNLDTSTLFGYTFINNIPNFLNSLNIPNFTFNNGLGFNSIEHPIQGLRITYPQNTTWQLTTYANTNGSDPDFVLIDGYRITQNGLQQWTTSNSFFSSPQVGSSIDQLNTVSDCTTSSINLQS